MARPEEGQRRPRADLARAIALIRCRASRRSSCTTSVPNMPPTTKHLEADKDEAASPGAGELWVGLMSLVASCIIGSAAGLDIGARVGLAKRRHGRHDGGIEGDLGPVPKGEAVRDNLDAPCIGYRHIEAQAGRYERLRHPVPTMQDTPPFLCSAVRTVLTQVFTEDGGDS